jgi:hypothetical protein
MVRSRLRHIQHRPELINALLGQTGLTLEPPPPYEQTVPFNRCKRAAAWQPGNDLQEEPAASGDDARAESGQCANCGAALPADRPAGHQNLRWRHRANSIDRIYEDGAAGAGAS